MSPRQPASPRSPLKPLPTAPNAEARSARYPQAPSGQHLGTSNQLSAAQSAASGQHPSLRKQSGSGQMKSRGSQTSLNQATNKTQSTSPIVHASSRQGSSPTQNPTSPLHSRQHSVHSQQQSLPVDASPPHPQHSPYDQNPRQRRPSKETTQGSFESPHLERAMSARRVAPVLRISSERVSQVKSTEPLLPANTAATRPSIPIKSTSGELVSSERRALSPQDSPPTEGHQQDMVGDRNGNTGDSQTNDEEEEPPGTDLPIQGLSRTKTPPSNMPLLLKRVSSHRVTIMSTSEYSPNSPRRSLENPITRETSPELHRNSRGLAPSHNSYGSISFLPMHPLLSPLQDPSDPWELGNQIEADEATTASPQQAGIPQPKPIPSQSDTEGTVNASHPLLLAERHTRFATKSPPIIAKIAQDLPLRHYRSSEVFQQARFGPSDEKEVFVPPKRSSSLIYDPAVASMRNPSPLSAHAENISAPTTQPLTTPSPLNVTQTQAILTVGPKLNLKSSKASIVTGPSSASVSTASIADDSATPPAISRNRSIIHHSKSTPNLLTGRKSVLQTLDTGSPESPKCRTATANDASIYIKPVSNTALIDFLKSTPPSSPSGSRAKSPTILKSRGNYGPVGKHSGPFSIFPSSPPPPSPGGRAMASLNMSGDGSKSIPTPTSPATEKKSWKKVFSGGSKKPKSGKGAEAPVLVNDPQPEKYRAKKKGHKKQRSEDAAQNGAERVTADGSGFMGVGKDGVWISRKNFLRT